MTKNNLPMWIVFGAAMVLSVTAGVFVGCDHGSNIPIDGVGGAGGDDGIHCALVCNNLDNDELVGVCDTYCGDVVCSIEGVEECSVACEVCLTRDRYLLQLRNERQLGYDTGFDDGYAQGFADGVDSVVCECEDYPPEGECDRPVPNGHLIKECRGKQD
jgi:hypothetical protein